MRFFITELPILPSSAEAPITATAFGMHDAVHRRDDFGVRARRRARLVVEVDDDAHVGGNRVLLGGEHRVEIEFDDFREIADELRHLDDDVGQRLAVDRIAAAHALRASQAAWMPSSIDSASSLVAGARRKVMSFSTSTSTPPRPKATSLPNEPSVIEPMITSVPPTSIC